MNAKISLFYAMIAVAGVAGVLIFIASARKLQQAGQAAGSAIGGVIADIIVDDPVSVNAAVLIPNLGVVPFDVIIAEGSVLEHEGGEVFTFRYRGVKYRIVPPRRPDGIYNAVRA